MKKQAILILSIVAVVIIITIIIALMIILKRDSQIGTDYEKYASESEIEATDIYVPTKLFDPVTERNKYFAVEKIVNTYLVYIKEMKGIINFDRQDDELVYQEGVDLVYSILDPEYISELNVQKEDLQSKI